jgi:hypothetical protein
MKHQTSDENEGGGEAKVKILVSVGDPRIRDILVRIRTSDYRIRTQLRIRLLSSVTLRMPKNFFFIFSYNLPAGTLFSVLKI